jgi:hypothetical protein
MVKHEAGYNYIRPGQFRRYTDWFLPITVFLGAMALYVKTMAPSIFWGDSAAFATSNYMLGLPHSPSFPLYTLLGRLINLIPNLHPAFASNLMSAIFAALSVTLFFILVKQMAETPVIQTNSNRRMLGSKKIDFGTEDIAAETILVETDSISKPIIVIIPCLAVTALFAISLPVWLSAVRAEVYSLHLFLSFAAALITFRGITANKKRFFFLGIWLYALSFANHPLLALAFAPAFLYLILIALPSIGFKPAIFGVLGLLFIAGFSVYFYLPIRSALEPAINWGRPDLLSSFWTAITRSSDMTNFSQMTAAPDYLMRLKKIGFYSADQIGWPLIGMALFGLWGIYKISRKLFLYFPLAILGNMAIVLWAADFTPRNYDMVNYLSPLFGLILIIGVAGMLYLLRFRIAALQSSIAITALIGVFAYFAIGKNMPIADMSHLDGPEVIAQNVVKNLPQGSLLIAAEDDLLLPLWYSAYVDSSAGNIRIISAGGMNNAKYRKQLTINYPDLAYPADFTNDLPGQPDSLTAQLCRLNVRNRDVYIQYGAPGVDFASIEPSGLLFKYVGSNTKPIVEKESYKTHISMMEKLVAKNPHEAMTLDFAGRWLFNTAVYFERIDQVEIAWQLFNKALSIDKQNIDMRIRLAAALARAGKLKEALQYISQALEIDPNDKNSLELGRHIVKALEKQRTVAAND